MNIIIVYFSKIWRINKFFLKKFTEYFPTIEIRPIDYRLQLYCV